MPNKRMSNRAEVRIVRRSHPGYQFAKRPIWKQFQPIYINAGEREKFDYTDYIENATPLGTYALVEASDMDGTPLDPRLSGVVVIQDETQPIVSVDASNVQVRSTIYFRFVHTGPNEYPYKSIWTSLIIRQTNNIR